jgi:putative transposase
MPSRNVLKIDIPESYYHIYARGNSRRDIFLDESDYATFFNLIRRYLSVEESKTLTGELYSNYHDKFQLLCFCLMPNHFHLLVYQKEEGVMTAFMRGVLTSYSRYFNKKYDMSGPLLESRYKASLISNNSYLEHISRYIYLNPKNWQSYSYSSLPYYLGKARADWVEPKKILDLFDSSQDYLTFVKDYDANKEMLQQLKYELANPTTA